MHNSVMEGLTRVNILLGLLGPSDIERMTVGECQEFLRTLQEARGLIEKVEQMVSAEVNLKTWMNGT